MKKIMWNPGHGGTDPGAVGNGLLEKELTLAITLAAMCYLNQRYTGFEQRATRTVDKTVSLSEAVGQANSWKADVFVSPHINAGGGTGFESFRFTNASPASVGLQNVVHDEIMKVMTTKNVRDRGKKTGNFQVIRETTMPAVLTESLFIDTAADAALLKDASFIKAIGEAHAEGVAKFLNLPKQVVAGVKDDISGHWAETSIRKALAKGVMSGYTDGSFGPNDNLTRAQLASVLDRLGLLD